MRTPRSFPRVVPTALLCLLAPTGLAQAQAPTETVIHSFGYFPNGANPYSPLLRTSTGTIYGTTYNGGQTTAGVLFRWTSTSFHILHSFAGGTDGANPYAGVVEDYTGNLYGTTYLGGAANAGVVYKVTPSGDETVLYSFTGGADGGNPYAGAILDSSGNLYGTTFQGGLTTCAGGCGVVYKIGPSGGETVLYRFTGGTDGANPYGGVIRDASGNLYGTTYLGGANLDGTVFKLSSSGHETVIHSFTAGSGGAGPQSSLVFGTDGSLYESTAGSDVVYKVSLGGKYTVLVRLNCLQFGGAPQGGVVMDRSGNLYGATDANVYECEGTPNYGAVFKVSTTGQVTVLYRFPGPFQLSSTLGIGPNGGVVLDPAGNIYGTTPYGGSAGMVYQLSAAGHETTLYNFPGAPGGTYPFASVTIGAGGGLYGTAGGGTQNAGVVYKIGASGTETVLYTFSGGTDGRYPESAVVLDKAGNVYGTTVGGGAVNQGVIYKVSPSGEETVLHSFTGGADGGFPNGVVLDSAGNLYGTTEFGGSGSLTGLQEGVVSKLDPGGNETVLHSFTGLSDGGEPTAGVVLDAAGNLYGTTYHGGEGSGVVYKLSPSGQETVLHTFTGGADGGYPIGGVVLDSSGNLYGAAAGDGILATGYLGQGVVFELSASGTYTPIYTFTGGTDGGSPNGVIRDSAGNLYGTTNNGGLGTSNWIGFGVVFEIDPSGKLTVLQSFPGGADGANPEAGVVLGAKGVLYGTTPWGGTEGIPSVPQTGAGVVYKITTQ